MKTNFAVLFSPNEANGQTATQFPACGFIANSTLEPCAKNVQFRFRHDALQSEHQTIIKERRMVKAVAVSDQSVRDRKSTRLNSSHRCISYAVFCLKKKIMYISV